MRALVFTLYLVIAIPAFACDDDVPLNLQAEFQLAVAQPDSGARRDIERLLADAPDSFCLRYELAFIHLRANEHEDAINLLRDLDPDKGVPEYFGETALNARGFAKLMLQRYEGALEDFSKQIEAAGFEDVPQSQRLKVHNNRGFTLLQLDRYEEALEELEIARELGSKLAEQNIQVVLSIVETLMSGDPNLPGTFAAVVATSRDPYDLARVRDMLLESQAAEPGEFNIFERPNGMQSLTVGANESYPKAEGRLTVLRTVVPQAFVASVAEWRNVTVRRQLFLGQAEITELLGPHGEKNGYTPPLSSVALPVPLPLSWDASQLVNSIEVHEKIACNLAYVVDKLHKENLLKQLESFAGAYNPRKRRGGSTWSIHSWAVAIDFDPDNNRLEWGRDRARFARPEYERLHQIFEEGGFVNMGRARNFEWGHFQIRGGILRGLEAGPPTCREKQ